MKLIDQNSINTLSNKAQTSERKRANYNLHEELNDSVQRFFNAIEPGTYVRPHRHNEKDKWELFVIIRGKAMVAEFADNGALKSRHMLDPSNGIVAIEIPERTWHTLVSLEPGTVLYENKKGPYSPVSDKDFASWAPNEGDQDTQQFIDWFCNAEIGSLPPAR